MKPHKKKQRPVSEDMEANAHRGKRKSRKSKYNPKSDKFWQENYIDTSEEIKLRYRDEDYEEEE